MATSLVLTEKLTRDELREELMVMRDEVKAILNQELLAIKELLRDGHGSKPEPSPSQDTDKKPRRKENDEPVGHICPPTNKSGYAIIAAEYTDDSSRNLLLDISYENKQSLEQSKSAVCELALSIVSSFWFENFEIILVILNSVWLGFEADYAASTWSLETPFSFQVVDWLFCIGFVAEVSLKLVAKGSNFFCSPEAKWNIFDFCVAFSQLAESLFQLFEHSQDDGNIFISTLRMLRLVRIIRVARIAVVLRELRALVTSICASISSLVWTVLLIFLCIYMFGISVTQLVNEAKVSNGRGPWEEEAEELLSMFNSLGSTMITLYMIISEGIHWKEVLDPLEKEVSIWMRPAMCLYVAFQLFAMMNVITSYFVDETLKQAAESTRHEVTEALWQILEQDAKEQGITSMDDLIVTKEEFHRLKDHPKMHEYVELIGCTMDEFDDVFHLIDADGDANLTCKEFIHGASSLTGTASASSIARLRLSNRFLREKVEQNHNAVVSIMERS